MEGYFQCPWQEIRQPSGSVALAICDPVYSDRDLSYLYPVWRWLRPGGSLYVFGDASCIARVKSRLDDTPGWTFQNWLVWGPNDWGGRSKNRWGQKHDDILFYTKDGAPHYFDGDAVAVPKKMTQAVFNPSGRTTKIPHSVWSDLGGFSTMSKERVRVNGTAIQWQKPEAVIERIVLASSRPGDLVLDPFAGVATVSAVCHHLGRRCLATEIESEVHAAGIRRLKQSGS